MIQDILVYGIVSISLVRVVMEIYIFFRPVKNNKQVCSGCQSCGPTQLIHNKKKN